MDKAVYKKWLLRFLDFADIIALVVLESIAMKTYNERSSYVAVNGYLVAEGKEITDCDLDEAYQYDEALSAQENVDIINRFTLAPLVLAAIGLVIDFFISLWKLIGNVSDKWDERLTSVQLFLTFLFAPLCFPLADFDYDDCIGTGLSDEIMNKLSTYSSIGFTMLIALGIIIGVVIVLHVVCMKFDETKKKWVNCCMGFGYLIALFYVIIALMFLIFAFLGTLVSLGTGILVGVGGVIEGFQLYAAARETQDVGSKVGLTPD